MGDACTVDGECVGGANAACIPPSDWPAGYCTVVDCGSVGCPAEAGCFQMGSDLTACLDLCQSNDDCRADYICMADAGACIPGCDSLGCSDGSICTADGTCQQDPTVADDLGGVGEACTAASQCQGGAGSTCWPAPDYPGGYCTVQGCDTAGCPGDASCWNFQQGESFCLDNCTGDTDCRDGYICDGDDTCWPDCTTTGCSAGLECLSNGHCGDQPPCTANSCGAGLVCGSGGKCVPDLGWAPSGPIPDCASGAPPMSCTGSIAWCGDLIQFNPSVTAHYDDYPINYETAGDQWRSWIRRDVSMLIDHATYMTQCLSQGWPGNGGALGLGDMSEANGAIPGTAQGSPGHPENTHEGGYDMDIGYYQVGTPDNRLRAVCDHYSGGSDQYHCVSEPYMLDVWRTALVLGILMTSDRTRVIGVDGKVGAGAMAAMEVLCDSGWLPSASCSNADQMLAYEITNTNKGWYHFHHHHFHISTWGVPGSPFGSVLGTTCLTPSCEIPESLADLGFDSVLGHGVVINPKKPQSRIRVKAGSPFLP